MSPLSHQSPSSISDITNTNYPVDQQFLTLYLTRKKDNYFSIIPKDIIQYIINPMLKESANSISYEEQQRLLDYFFVDMYKDPSTSESPLNMMLFQAIANRITDLSEFLIDQIIKTYPKIMQMQDIRV